jgi:hypothetical protein
MIVSYLIQILYHLRLFAPRSYCTKEDKSIQKGLNRWLEWGGTTDVIPVGVHKGYPRMLHNYWRAGDFDYQK